MLVLKHSQSSQLSNLRNSIERRLNRVVELKRFPRAIPIEQELCRRDVVHWFNNWVWTYDPKRVTSANSGGAFIPFDLFERQVELLEWFKERVALREDGLVEKSRDIGYTWVAGGFATHQWLYNPGFKTTFGSRVEQLVDKIGNPDSILEKIRMLLQYLPDWMLPEGFKLGQHATYMRIFNPANGNLISGEAGDQMGRGGRSSLYIVDEAAFIERADRVEASTSGNADVRIWGSSVNGMGNLFARKRHGGRLRPAQIFRYHYTSDPRKTPEWAEKKKLSTEPHIWASEYDLDYSASVEGICIPAAWVKAAQRIGKVFDFKPSTSGTVGGDVGAGKAASVAVARFGPVVYPPVAWLEPDTTDTANKMMAYAQDFKISRPDGFDCLVKTLKFDNVGVGVGVSSAFMHNPHATILAIGVNVGLPPSDRYWPDGETSADKFINSKAEGWWRVRAYCKASFEKLLFHEGKAGGIDHPLSDCISLPEDTAGPDSMAMCSQLSLVKYFKNEKGKIQIESKDQLAKRGIKSPDHAEALVLTCCGDDDMEIWERLGQ